MEPAPVVIPLGGRSNTSGDGSNAKRKLESAHSLYSFSAMSSPINSPTVSPNSSDASRTNADALPPLVSHLKVRRRSTAGPPSLLRCYSDGKISKAFGELVTAENSQKHTKPNVYSTPRVQAQQSTPLDDNCACPSPGPHRNPFLSEEMWPLSVRGEPTSTSPALVTKSNKNESTNPQKSGNINTILTSTTPNKRVCSKQGLAQSKVATNWLNKCSPSLPQARKRSLGVSDATRLEKGSRLDKQSSLSIDMNLESRNNAVGKIVPSCSSTCSTPPVTALSRGSVSVPKKMYLPQQRRSRNPGNLSLDLSQVDQTNVDPSKTGTGDLKRRNDQAAVCSKLTDFLYIGGAVAAKNKSMLIQNGITHIINCAASVAPASYPDVFNYLNIRLRDHSSQDIARHFYSLFDFIERARESGGRIFLHCVKGISRSPTMAIAYLMWYKNTGMYKALDFVRQARPIVDPNAGFIFQLTEWEHLHSEGKIKFQGRIVFRIDVAYANLNPKCNKEGIVELKTPLFTGPLPSISENYFRDPTQDIGGLCMIIACADYMFVWCGTDVSEDKVDVAERGAQLLQRYEAFPFKCDTVRQGQEPVAFWNLVGHES